MAPEVVPSTDELVLLRSAFGRSRARFLQAAFGKHRSQNQGSAALVASARIPDQINGDLVWHPIPCTPCFFVLWLLSFSLCGA